jgi:hypothetical protein
MQQGSRPGLGGAPLLSRAPLSRAPLTCAPFAPSPVQPPPPSLPPPLPLPQASVEVDLTVVQAPPPEGGAEVLLASATAIHKKLGALRAL